jgi:hypothetical protein
LIKRVPGGVWLKDPLDEIIKAFNERWFQGWEATPEEQRVKFIHISKKNITVRKAAILGRPWTTNVEKPASNKPTRDVKELQTAMFKDKALKDY